MINDPNQPLAETRQFMHTTHIEFLLTDNLQRLQADALRDILSQAQKQAPAADRVSTETLTRELTQLFLAMALTGQPRHHK
jgi:hypothetical protein